MLVTSSRCAPAPAHRSASSDGTRVRLARPAVDGDAPVTHVDGYHEAVAEPCGRLLEEPGREGGRADHDTVSADGQRRRDRLERPVAAADLDGTADGSDDPLEKRRGGDAVERAVEVDEVESDGALGVVASGELDGVAAFERHVLAPSTRQTHHASGEDVDRGDHFEFAC